MPLECEQARENCSGGPLKNADVQSPADKWVMNEEPWVSEDDRKGSDGCDEELETFEMVVSDEGYESGLVGDGMV